MNEAQRHLEVIVPDQLWSLSHDIRMMPGVMLPARMVVIRLDTERLVLHSPVPLDDSHIAALHTLGRVAFIIAPNNYHHLYLRSAIDAFPEAEVWAAPGLPVKRKGLSFKHLLGPDAAPPFADLLSPMFLAGAPKMDETVFLHHATRTLIVTDAFFNITKVKGFLSPLVFRLTGSLNKPGQSRIWRAIVKDRKAMAASSQVVAATDFDRIVMAHGEVIATDGHAAWQRAIAWLDAR